MPIGGFFTKIQSKAKVAGSKTTSLFKHMGAVADIPDEVWESHIKKMETNYGEASQLVKYSRNCLADTKSLLITMISMSNCLGNMVIEEDSAQSKEIRTKYSQTTRGFLDETYVKCFERLEKEIIPTLNEYTVEIDFLIKLCDNRTSYKVERDHYNVKMNKLISSHEDQQVIDRNSEKQNRTETQLQMIEAPLLLRIQDFEGKHDAIMSYVFDVLTSSQKQFFFEISTRLSGYKSTVSTDCAPVVPLIKNHGSRMDIEEVIATIKRQEAQAKAMPQKSASTYAYNQQPVNQYGQQNDTSVYPQLQVDSFGQHPPINVYQQPQIDAYGQQSQMGMYGQQPQIDAYGQQSQMGMYGQQQPMNAYQQPQMDIYGQQPSTASGEYVQPVKSACVDIPVLPQNMASSPDQMTFASPEQQPIEKVTAQQDAALHYPPSADVAPVIASPMMASSMMRCAPLTKNCSPVNVDQPISAVSIDEPDHAQPNILPPPAGFATNTASAESAIEL